MNWLLAVRPSCDADHEGSGDQYLISRVQTHGVSRDTALSAVLICVSSDWRGGSALRGAAAGRAKRRGGRAGAQLLCAPPPLLTLLPSQSTLKLCVVTSPPLPPYPIHSCVLC
eukprot:3660071-Pleurochrysis_carterae.AAC.1